MELVEEGEDLGVEAVRVHVDDGGHPNPQECVVGPGELVVGRPAVLEEVEGQHVLTARQEAVLVERPVRRQVLDVEIDR